MSADGEGGGISKSAKRRAAKKARDAAGGEAEEEAPPEPPAPEAQAKPKAKSKAEAKAEAKGEAKAAAKAQPKAPASQPAEEPKAKAKGKAKAKAEPEPPASIPAAEPKAKGKAKAKAQAEPAAPPPAPKAEPKAKANPAKSQPAAPKAKAKAAAKVVEEEEAPAEKEELVNWTIDDGKGGDWLLNSGVTKKQQRRKERFEEEKAVAKAAGVRPGAAPQYIPGMGPANAGQAANTANAKSSQAVAASEVQRILDMKSGIEMPAPGSVSTATVHVPEKKIGIVIGPKGSKVQMIQEKTGAKIDTTGEIFTITGPPQAVAQAEQAVKELVEKGYCAMQYDDFAENFVNVHPSCFPDLIGKQGVVIKEIKDKLGVEVNIPPVPPGSAPSKKFKVGLAGSTANVEKAKNVINEIVMYGHSEITHPGVVHEEMEVDPWAYRYIIGKGGSEMKHIQHNWKVKVNIPREHSANQMVTVVGDRDQVDRAKAYIEKVLWNAENQAKGRDKAEAAEDVWGDEGEEEEWMKAYIYKR